MEPVELPAAGLLLRPWDRTEDDRQAVLHGLADPEFRRWNTVNAPTADAAGAQDFLTSAVEGWASGDQLSWAVTDASAGGRVLGNVALGTVDLRMRRARVSYWLLPQARGRGAATRALAAVTPWAFATLDLIRLELGHAADNHPSCRVALRCGYRAEGRLRSAMISTDGRTVQDVHLHARLVHDADPVPGDAGAPRLAAEAR